MEKKYKTIKVVKHHYYTIKNADEFDRMIKKLVKEETVCFDTETDSKDPMQCNLVGMSFAYKEEEAYYVPVYGNIKKGDSLFDKQSNKENIGVEINEAIEKIKTLLENKKVKIVGQNIKYDYLVMKNYGIEIANIDFDSLIGAFILKPEGAHDMDSLAEDYLGYSPISIETLIGKGKNQITMDKVEVDKVSEYASEDADITLQLCHRIKYELEKINLLKLCDEIEFPLIRVLAEMEFQGIKVDKKILLAIDKQIMKSIDEFEKKIYELAGEKFNINSPKQLQELLYTKLNLKPTKKTKTGFSTDVKVLEELRYQHPIAAAIVDYRMLTKLKSTYIEGLVKAINPKDGRVHTSYSQIGAATGRLSSTNPNLQNIPIRTEIGRSLRKAFVPENKNQKILSADYSQIELRIMAHYAGDENMINAFKRNHDIHTETAMRVFGLKDKKEVTPNMRRKAKEVNFGIIYGIGAFGLANRLEIKNTEAKDIIERYFREYPKVLDYMERTKKFARENGYVETLMGRRRYLMQINNQNASARAEDERAAINMPIQGTAADMIKIAMINIDEAFKKNKIKSKMLLQVHDELVFEVYDDETEKVKNIVTSKMKNAIPMDVPIEVEVGIGKDWFDAH
ncbi:MAG TPA: DNA polymerase I [Bacteroidetes bacterium]|nr:DNA polymerase I [Bacteroidota bacterium]